MRKKLISIGLIFMAMTLLCGCGDITKRKARVGSKDVFAIANAKCTLSEAKLILAVEKEQYREILDLEEDLWTAKFGDETMEDEAKNRAISKLSYLKCLSLMAGEQKISLDGNETKKAEEAALEFYGNLSEELRKYIGIDKNGLIKLYKEYALSIKAYNSITVDSTKELSDDDARVITIQQIFTSQDKETADKALSEIKSGHDFNSVSKKYNKSDTAEFTVARNDLEDALEEAAFNLGTGETSEVVKGQKGYYIFYCVNHYEKELTEENKEKIASGKKSGFYDQVYKPFVENLQFEFNHKLWDEVTFEPETDDKCPDFYGIYDKHFK